MERWTSSMIVLATMAIGCGSSDRKPLMLMTQAAAPKCAAPSGDTEVDKICKPKMNSGVKVGFLMGLATKDQCLDGPAASAAVPGKAKPAVVPPIPDLIIQNGWLYVTGDSPTLEGQNVVVAQAEGSRLIIRKVANKYHVLVLDAGANGKAYVWPKGLAGSQDGIAVPEEHYIRAFLDGTVVRFEGPYAFGAGEWTFIDTVVKPKRFHFDVP